MTRCDKSAVQQYRQVWFWLLLWMFFVPGVQAATDCNAVTEISVSECQSLLELYNSTDGPNWKNNTGWNQTNTPCSWFGVTCEKGHVTEIRLGDEGLKGQIPDLNLSNLRKLILTSNRLNGSIPDFSNLPNLEILALNLNQLSGSIPNFSNLPNLQYLGLSSNQLSGSIPNFSNLPNLQYLGLGSNQLSGSVPDFSDLPNLQYLGLGSNQLSGSVPDFSDLPNLQSLGLGSNQLSGNITNFSNLPKLTALDLMDNQLIGNIPNFDDLPKLTKLWLNNNQLSGRIPNFTAFNLADLEYAYFRGNYGLAAYDAAQESVLNSKDPDWQTLNPNWSVTPVPNISSIAASANDIKTQKVNFGFSTDSHETTSTVYHIDNLQSISALAITGGFRFQTSNGLPFVDDSFIRIILVNNDTQKEFLVYERTYQSLSQEEQDTNNTPPTSSLLQGYVKVQPTLRQDEV